MPQIHINREVYLKALIYGDAGAGKTTLAYTAVQHPSLAKAMFLSVDGGMLSVPQDERVLYEEISNSYESSDSTNTAYKRVEALFWEIANYDLKKSPWLEETKTIIIDSGTELMTQHVERLKDNGLTGWKLYEQETVDLKKLFRNFRSLPFNIIVTALAQDIFEESKIKDMPPKWLGCEPSFTTKLRKSIEGYFDHVWYMKAGVDDKGNDVHTMLTRPRAGFYAKTRYLEFSEALGVRVANPNLATIYQLLVDKVKGE